MKVKDLVAALSKFDENLDVVCYTEDESVLAEGHGFRLLDIASVAKAKGDYNRSDDGLPTMKFVDSKSEHVFLYVNAEF